MARSGSTFAFQIVKEICGRHLSKTSGKFYNIKDIYPEAPSPYFLNFTYNVSEFAAKAHDLVGCQKNRIIVAKIHQECLPKVQEMINSGHACSVSTFRHPEEIALSLVDSSFQDKLNGRNRFKFFTIEETINDIKTNIENYRTWKNLDNNLNIFYDRLVLDPYTVAKKINNHFGFMVETKAIVDFFLDNSEKRIGEYNKGIVDRNKTEFPENMKFKFYKNFSQFIEYVNEIKRYISSS